MPETPHNTPHHHRSRSHSSRSHSGQHHKSNNLVPVYYFSGAILLLIIAKLLKTGMLSPSIGAAGIIILAISKIWESKPGIVISTIFLVAMTMVNIWQWVNVYIFAILSGNIIANTQLFVSGLSEGLILAGIAWTYHRLLRSIHIHMSQRWFVKRSYVILCKMLFYAQMFLALFWMSAFLMGKWIVSTRLGIQDSTMIAGAIALLAAGIPAISYLSKRSPGERKSHSHRHHRRQETNVQQKNPERFKKRAGESLKLLFLCYC
ncbi:MAG: hypothetical protein ACOYNC_06040 [Bacteroidales bacterium]